MDDWKELDEFDPADVRRAIIEALREDGGVMFRRLLRSSWVRGDSELRDRLLKIPELHDLMH